MNDDLISRFDAIAELDNVYGRLVNIDMSGSELSDELEDIVLGLPTVQLKTGHWIEDAKTYYEELKKRSLGVDEYTPYFTDDIACSECLAKYSVLDNETQFFKYCPNCGAKMEGEKNG